MDLSRGIYDANLRPGVPEIGTGSSVTIPATLDSRAPTPRMQLVTGGQSNTFLPSIMQQPFLNQYLMGAAAAGNSLPRVQMPYQFPAVNQSHLLLAAASADWNAQSNINQRLLQPTMTSLPLHPYHNPYVVQQSSAPSALAAMYYNQLAAFAQQAMPSTNLTAPVRPVPYNLPTGSCGSKNTKQICGERPPLLTKRHSIPFDSTCRPQQNRASLATTSEDSRKDAQAWEGAQSATRHRPLLSITKPKSPESQKEPLSSPEAIKQHITRLISENEAIVEPLPQLMNKRRSYLKLHSAGQRDIAQRKPSSSVLRSYSLVESGTPLTPTMAAQKEAAFRHRSSLPSGILETIKSHQPANTPATNQQQSICAFCKLVFANEKSLNAHVFRCSSNKVSQISPSEISPVERTNSDSLRSYSASSSDSAGSAAGNGDVLKKPQHPLKRKLLAASEQHAEASATQSQLKQSKLEVSTVEYKLSSEQLSTPKEAIVFCRANRCVLPLVSSTESQSTISHQSMPVSVSKDSKNLDLCSASTIGHSAACLPNLVGPFSPIPQSEYLCPMNSKSLKPYCVTIPVPSASKYDVPRSGKQPRHVTATTFVCLKRPQPMYVMQGSSSLSMYNNWKQLPVHTAEAQLNVKWLGCCYMRPKKESQVSFKYVTATKEGSAARMTHSSFWEISKKLRQDQHHQCSDSELRLALVPNPDISATAQIDVSTAAIPTTIHKGEEFSANSANSEVFDAAKPTIKDDDSKNFKEGLLTAKNCRESFRKRLFGCSKVSDVQIYIRGRGKGRYVCDQCGIRCKKPSMLLKHMNSHQNIRPFSCGLCSFSFKTKGNLTKHSKSKAHASMFQKHLKDSVSKLNKRDSCDIEDKRLEIDSNAESDDSNTASVSELDSSVYNVDAGAGFHNECDACSSSDKSFRSQTSFDSENNRLAMTPLARWSSNFSDFENRNCASAPCSLSFEYCKHPATFDSIFGKKPTKSTDTLSASEKSDFSPTATVNPFYSAECRPKCELCGEEFLKNGHLRLHMSAHYYEMAGQKVQTCSICKAQLRGKTALEKHMLFVHGSVSADGETESPNAQTQEIDAEGLQKSSADRESNPRPFRCDECATAFRIQGHLAKHLRSKMHITKLECQKKIPIGTYALLESLGFNLNEVDTSDSEMVLQSLQKIAVRLHLATPTSQNKKEEESLLSPLKSRSDLDEVLEPVERSELPIPAVSAPLSCSPKVQEDAPDNCSKTKSITADLWVPPKEIPRPETNSSPAEVEPHTRLNEKSLDVPPKSPKSPLLMEERQLSAHCLFCDQEYSCVTDLEVHLHADHIVMRDGPDFRCPRVNCYRLYPNKDTLRLHVAGHFFGEIGRPGTKKNDASRAISSASQKPLSNSDLSLGIVKNPSMATLEDRTSSVLIESAGRRRLKAPLVSLSSIPEVFSNGCMVKGAARHNESPISDQSENGGSRTSSTKSANSPGLTSIPRQLMIQDQKVDKMWNRRCVSAMDSYHDEKLVRNPLVKCAQNGISMPIVPSQLQLAAAQNQAAALAWLKRTFEQLNALSQVPMDHTIKPSLTGTAELGVKTVPDLIEDRFEAMVTNGSDATESIEDRFGGLVCIVCKKPYFTANDLQDHLLTHVSDRPHICEYCDAGFTTAHALSNHLATHNLQAGKNQV